MQKAIVVGASSGIGKALAIILAQNGYHVGITGRRTALLNELYRTKPTHFYPLSFDVTDNLETQLEQLVKQLGGLDLLVFSAGIGELNDSLAIDVELSTIKINVEAFNTAVVWAYHYFAQQRAGKIAAISSIAGLRGSAIAPAYNASKAYQINYLEGLRQKAKQQHLAITITDIRPGFVATAMAKGARQFWLAQPEKAAQQIYVAIKTKRNVIYVTKRWKIIAWLFKILPRFVYERM